MGRGLQEVGRNGAKSSCLRLLWEAWLYSEVGDSAGGGERRKGKNIFLQKIKSHKGNISVLLHSIPPT